MATYLKEIKVNLTPVEIADRVQGVITEKFKEIGKLKNEVKGLNAEIKALEAEKQEQLQICSDGFEIRLFDCYDLLDYENKQVSIFRCDTQELVETREATAPEIEAERKRIEEPELPFEGETCDICKQDTEECERTNCDGDPAEDEAEEIDDFDPDAEPADELINQAAAIIRKNNKSSVSFLQKGLKIGYNRAAIIMEQLEKIGVVGPQVGSKAREILPFEAKESPVEVIEQVDMRLNCES